MGKCTKNVKQIMNGYEGPYVSIEEYNFTFC